MLYKVLFLFFSTICLVQGSQINYEKNPTIAIYNGEANLLFFVAKKYELFKKFGLNPKLDKYVTGKKAMEKMLLKQADYSTSTEFVNIKNSLKTNKFTILSSLSEIRPASMIGIKANKIYTPIDLKNKKLGVAVGTAGEFYAGIFLNQYNLSLNDVNIINVHPSKRYDVIENKSVDALISWEPYTYNLLEKYKNELSYFDMPVNFNFYFLLSANKDFHEKNPLTSKKILQALLEAEKLIIKNPMIINYILKEEFNYDEDYINYTLKKHFFSVSLPYSLSVLMGFEKKWLIEKANKDFFKDDFHNLFDTTILKSIYKSRVTLIDLKGDN